MYAAMSLMLHKQKWHRHSANRPQMLAQEHTLGHGSLFRNG